MAPYIAPPMPTSPSVFRFTLANGLRVILQETHAAPVVAYSLWVRVGSGDETDAESGIAHVHEHMLFKGTARRGVGEIAMAVEGSGGQINAYTSFDQTVYYCTIASRYLDVGLDVLADAAQNSSFDPGELAREEEVVLEEIKRGEDSPGTKISRILFETAYRVHPYRRPIIGTEAHVRSFSREMITDFYRRWYVPNNMVLVAVGDFGTEALRRKIEEAFGAFPAKPVPGGGRSGEPPQTALRSAVVPDTVQQSYMQMAFPACDLLHPDAPALEVLALILGQGESSRLYRRVKAEQQKVHDVRAHAYTLRDPGLFLLGALVDPGREIEAQLALLREIFRLREDRVSSAELSKARLNIEAEAIYDKETVQGQAHKLGFFEALAGDVAFEADFLARVKAVTPEEVRRVAQWVFSPERLSVALLVPHRAARALTPGAILEAAERARPSAGRARVRPPARSGATARRQIPVEGAPEAAVAAGPPDRPPSLTVLPNGLRIIVKESHAVPVVSIRVAMLGGLLIENRRNNGISDLMANMLTKGTRRRNAEDIAEEIERIAGSINAFSGRNGLGLEVEVLSRHFRRAVDLLVDVTLAPTFEARELEKQRRDTLAAIARREDDLAGFAVDAFASTLYERHPYRLTTLGTPASVKRLTRADLRRTWARLCVPANLVITVVGDVGARQVIAALRRAFGKMKPRAFERPRLPREVGPRAPKRREILRDKAQAHLLFGFLGTTLHSHDKYALEVMNTILAGQGGRLFVELRDRQSLAYSVTSFSLEGIDPGYVAVYMGTSPEKVRRAIAGVRRELERIRRETVPAEELERAKRHVVGSYEIDQQRATSQTANLGFNELYGLGLGESRAYPEKILAVTAEDVRGVARKYLRMDRPVAVLVRPPALRKLARKTAPPARRARRPASR